MRRKGVEGVTGAGRERGSLEEEGDRREWKGQREGLVREIEGVCERRGQKELAARGRERGSGAEEGGGERKDVLFLVQLSFL